MVETGKASQKHEKGARHGTASSYNIPISQELIQLQEILPNCLSILKDKINPFLRVELQ
jgi:hypothetical protein